MLKPQMRPSSRYPEYASALPDCTSGPSFTMAKGAATTPGKRLPRFLVPMLVSHCGESRDNMVW